MKKCLILVISFSFLVLIVAVFISVAKPINWQAKLKDAKAVARIVKGLVDADKVYIHSRMLSGDVDNDAKNELVISATVINHDEENYLRVTHELILLSKKRILFWNKYWIKAREKFRTKASTVYLNLRDLTGDGKLEIIISDSKNPFYLADNQIYRLEKEKLLPVLFKGGEFDGMHRLTGNFDFKASVEQKGYDVAVRYGPGLGVSDNYRWNGENYVVYSEATKGPGAKEQRIISYLKGHITEHIRDRHSESSWSLHDIQFYPPDKLVVYAETSHIALYVLFEYALDGDVIILKNLEQFSKYRPGYLEGKYNLLPTNAVNYFVARIGNYKWTPSNVFE